MEDNGILFDMDYRQQLSEKYNKLLQEKLDNFNELVSMYDKEIEDYKIKNPNHKLDTPINVASPTQLAILFYDIIGCEAVDPKSPRGTGEEILKRLDNPIADAILEWRSMSKLVDTYIDKLPNCVNPKDGRIHCSFNQYGAKTGRMSSSNPNLQNIPSHNKDIRKMFIASPGYVLMSSDFSQQEPKCLAALCRKHGDSQMYNTFMQGKDLYSEIASKAFDKPYEECREFNVDGTTNKAGKERRTQAKSILLGVLYGRGEASIGEQLNVSTKKAKDIKDSVFKGFPAIKQFEQDSLDMGKQLGYVTTVCGRKRRLPELQLDEYEFTWKDGAPPDDDILDFDSEEVVQEIPERTKRKYLTRLHNSWGSQKRKIFEEANAEGIWIVDNGMKIADATRQTVNSRIQGSAADLTKLAMIELANNTRLKELGFRLLIPVHDEVIAECPEENVKECSKLLAETMSKAAEKILEMPIKCDVEITKEWYGEGINYE
jgi:DNA polymerase I-like protein with 3'-5' exonuclease and polymerase domains